MECDEGDQSNQARSAGSIPAVHFDSSDHSTADRFEIWNNAVSASFDLEVPDGEKRSDIVARESLWMLGTMIMSHGFYSAQRMARTQRKVRQSQLDHYRLSLPLRGGATRLTIDDQRHHVREGQILITDMARADCRLAEQGDRVLIVMPRDAVDALLPRPVDLHGLMPHGPVAALLSAHVRRLPQVLPELRPESAQGVFQATLHLFAAAVAPLGQAPEATRSTISANLRRQVEHYVQCRLMEQDLTADQICGAFRISRTTLYRLMQPLGGVNAYIQRRRLLRIHRLLASPVEHRHLGQIADQHGFKSQAHMSRVYRQQFGYSPSETALSVGANPALQGNDRVFGWLNSISVR
jgi:AraC-like DNA-binding protein